MKAGDALDFKLEAANKTWRLSPFRKRDGEDWQLVEDPSAIA